MADQSPEEEALRLLTCIFRKSLGALRFFSLRSLATSGMVSLTSTQHAPGLLRGLSDAAHVL
jgi:hypothetical protein